MRDEFNLNIKSCKNSNKIVVYNPLFKNKIDNLINYSNEVIYSIPSNKYWISLGRYIPEKGFDLLIKSYAKYYNENFLPLYIFGNGPEYDKLQFLISNFNLKDKIFLINYTTNPYIFIKNANGCILPSRIEGFPNILNEMIYLNENVLSTICVPEISNLDFISICLPNDIDSLGTSLLNLIDSKVISYEKRLKRIDYLDKLDSDVYFLKVLF